MAADGRFWWRIDGALPEEAHFDHRELTLRDFNGTVSRVSGRDAIVPRVLGALLGAARRSPSAAWPVGTVSYPETSATAFHGADGDSVWAVIATLQGQERLIGRPTSAGGFSIARSVGPHEHTSIRIDSVISVPDRFPTRIGTDNPPMRVRFPDDRRHPIETRRASTGQVLIRARVGSETRWWIFDTGASESVVDREFATRLGVGAVGRSLVTSMFGQEAGSVYRLPRFEIGPVVVEGLAAVATDLSALSAAVGEPLAGIVGFDLLSRAVVEFDVGAGAVSMGSSAAAFSREWSPLRLLDRHPVLDGSIESIGGRLRLDTGAGPGLIVNRWVSETAGLLEGRASSPVAGTPFEARLGTVERLRIGPYSVGPVTALFVTGGDGPIAAVFNDRDLLGNVGAEVLGRVRAVFDYRQSRVALLPKS